MVASGGRAGAGEAGALADLCEIRLSSMTSGHDFVDLCHLPYNARRQELWRRWVERAAAGHSDAPVSLPAAEFVMGECMLRVRKIGLYP